MPFTGFAKTAQTLRYIANYSLYGIALLCVNSVEWHRYDVKNRMQTQ